MRALVVGVSGLVGGAVSRALERSGIEAVGTFRSRRVEGARALDVLDSEAVRRCLEATRPDVVVLAVDAAADAEAQRLHADGTRSVAAGAAAAGARVVYYSSDAVFDGQAGPYAEDAPLRPVSAYGRLEAQAEQEVRRLDPRHLIVRTSEVYGWDRGSRNLAMQVSERLQADGVLRVAADRWASPTFVDYLAEVTVRLLQMGVEGTVNVAGKERMARADLARALARAMALDATLIDAVPLSELEPGAGGPFEGGLTCGKLEALLGTEPLDLGESLKRFRRQWRADTHVSHGPRPVSTEAERLKQEILDKVRQYHGLAHQAPPFVPFKSRVQYAGRVFGDSEMVNLVDSALDFWLTLGPWGDLFEQKMKRLFGARDFVLVNSGSTANLAALMTLASPQLERPLVPGDEVITPAVTFPTTLAPIVHAGLIPVFVDCEVGTYNVDPRLLEGAISPRTRAIVVPHTLGNPCDMDVIGELVRRHQLYLVEDSCDALGATFRGKLVGTFGDLATLSFFPAHHITLGEGGGVVVNNPALPRIVRSVRDWGRDCWCAPGESNTCGKRFGWQLGDLPAGYDHKYVYSNIGYNFKPTDLQAAIGVAQADRLAHFIEKRRRNFTRLYRGLEACQDRLVLPRLDPRANPSWFGFPITVGGGISRQELVQWLESANIETRQVFGGNILKQPGYRNISRRIHGTLEQTDRIMRDTFFVGVYPGLDDEMIDFVVGRVRDFLARR